MMQVPINKEIRHYEEDVFMGLSLRQTAWSAGAVAAAVGAYLYAVRLVPPQTASWVSMAAALPFAALAFFSYDQMDAWQFLAAVLQCSVICRGPRVWKSENGFQPRRTGKKGGRK